MSKKTKKVSNRNFKHLWTMFDSEIGNQKLECLYSTQKIHEKDKCDLCNHSLLISDEKFKVCSNEKCGITQSEK